MFEYGIQCIKINYVSQNFKYIFKFCQEGQFLHFVNINQVESQKKVIFILNTNVDQNNYSSLGHWKPRKCKKIYYIWIKKENMWMDNFRASSFEALSFFFKLN